MTVARPDDLDELNARALRQPRAQLARVQPARARPGIRRAISTRWS